ncbi:FAD-binding oxidoreductase [Croceicoccus sp. F390]|uniref:FAD-binding oxidoreductase n=1 Tax=Croceicoccus esteveae TaxID=3075597 RepID=A0ABU2ZLH9_9SPHN|nr:FAD-binding oxidoreductase [Croceicoccus sp. F390]MDT0577086.1 FAD-binding oxidoreductase [Croceicoccus sp. F390]
MIGNPKVSRTQPDRRSFRQGLVPISLSGWTAPEPPPSHYPQLQQDIDTDVIIIGAGLAGSSLALHLTEQGVDTVILEARQPGWGASGRNAGHVLPVLKDLRAFNRFPDQGKAFLDIFREHRAIPFDLSHQHGIDCDAMQSGYLNAATSKIAYERFKAGAVWLEDRELEEIDTLGTAQMQETTGSRHFTHGVVYKSGGRINPYLFTNGLLAAAVRMGAVVHGDSEAIALSRSTNRWRVRTSGGNVNGRRVVFCTNAYPGNIVPAFTKGFYPLTAYGVATEPLPKELADLIMPSGMTLAEVPIDLNPLVKDRHGRLVLSSIPAFARADDAAWHFANHLRWIHKLWPHSRDADIRLGHYWTGRVAMRKREFPGVFELQPGVFGLMYFNAWGNVMAPLLGKLFAHALARDEMDKLPFPIEKPEPVAMQRQREILIGNLLIPAARTARKIGLL